MLKSLELAGFKSFAEKTRLEFPPGVTVVVGPNGSGKSNVVDAIKWVLGSQSPKSLRGGEMADVIFGGAGERRPLNAAEVTLAFANPEPAEGARRLFDLDEPEVRLTRRVYRSGEGEYLINGRACRLKDFRELLAGTGIGDASYCIIEQGRVDAALQATPDGRRGLFEEAAGISRFRLKKREAFKRLERVEQNLLRLSDIVDEVEGRLRRVRAQAGKAQRYREQTRRLRKARVELAIDEDRALREQAVHLGGQQDELSRQLAETRRQAAEHDTATTASAGPSPTENALRTADRRLAESREQLARAEARRDEAGRRLENAEQLTRKAREAALHDEQRRHQAANEAAAGPTAAEAAAEALADCERKVAALAERIAAHAEHRQRLADRVAATDRRRERIVEQHDQHEAERRRAAETLAALALTEERLRAEAAEPPAGEPIAEALAEAVARRDAATEALARIEADGRATRRRLGADRDRLAELQRTRAAAEAELVAQRHRLETYAEERRRLERLNEDVARLTGAGAGLRVHGLVADLVHVDVDMAPLVEAALAGATQHVVIDSADALLDAVTRSDKGVGVRASFAASGPLENPAAEKPIDLSDEPGVMGRASDFVEVAAEFAPLVERLLAPCWFVDGLATALRLSRGHAAGLTFVTPRAETVRAGGVVTLGPIDESDNLLLRRRHAEALATRLQRLEAEQAERAREAAELETAIGVCERAVAERDPTLHAERERLNEALQRAAALEERGRHDRRRSERLRATLEKHHREHHAAERRLAELERTAPGAARLAAGDARRTRLAERLAAVDAAIASAEARRDELVAAAERHSVLVDSLRRPAETGGSPRVRPPGQRPAESDAPAADPLVEAESTLRDATLERLRAGDAWSSAVARRDRRRGELASAEEADRAARLVRIEIERAARVARDEAEQLGAQLAPIELRLQQVRLERETLAHRLREDYGLELATLADEQSTSGDAPRPVDREALRVEIDRLRRQVKNAGPVNQESLEELEALEARFEELSGQFRDLSQAKASLVRLTGRINADSRGLYLACFQSVRGHFRELFTRLFGGGEADLVLVGESDDPLEQGVEIVASPPGKTLRNLSLLSGGEKTMTCVALLLAMFRSNPSPFCVLDEVDAALDEANVERYAAVLREFRDSTQFLVITHSKRTMVGADTLYGVTMQESGVSTQVSVRFEDVGEGGHVRPRPAAAEGDPSPGRRAA